MTRRDTMTRKAPRATGDQGTALLEFALVAPVFLLIVFAVLEFGLVYRDSLTVSDAVNDAARTGAIQGPNVGAQDDDPDPSPLPPGSLPNATADFVTVKKLRQGLGLIPVEWIKRIVIFKAQDPVVYGSADEQLSQSCKDGIGSPGSGAPDYIGACNVYDAEDAFRAYEAKTTSYFNCALSAASPECDWPRTVRSAEPFNPVRVPPNPGPDYLGVWVEIERPFLTGLFGEQFNLSDSAIVRLEPGLVEE